jgi:hypothetical protein
MDALERLMAESWPDGTFGGSRPAGAPVRARREVTPAEAAAHYARLDAACQEIRNRPRVRGGRHLHVVPETTKDAA